MGAKTLRVLSGNQKISNPATINAQTPMLIVAQSRDAVELMAEVRKASAPILVRRAHGDVKLIVSHLTDKIPLLKLDAAFADGSPVQKADFPAGIIKEIGPPRIDDLFG